METLLKQPKLAVFFFMLQVYSGKGVCVFFFIILIGKTSEKVLQTLEYKMATTAVSMNTGSMLIGSQLGSTSFFGVTSGVSESTRLIPTSSAVAVQSMATQMTFKNGPQSFATGTTSMVLIFSGTTLLSADLSFVDDLSYLVGYDFLTLVNSKISQLQFTVQFHTSTSFGVTANLSVSFLTRANTDYGYTSEANVPRYTHQTGYTVGVSIGIPILNQQVLQRTVSAPVSSSLFVPANVRIMPILSFAPSAPAGSFSMACTVTFLLSSA